VLSSKMPVQFQHVLHISIPVPVHNTSVRPATNVLTDIETSISSRHPKWPGLSRLAGDKALPSRGSLGSNAVSVVNPGPHGNVSPAGYSWRLSRTSAALIA
jgi:hypothetical protein